MNLFEVIDNLHLQIAILKSDIEDIKAEKNLYKKLFEDEIALHYSKNSNNPRKRVNPAFMKWLMRRAEKRFK